MTTIDDVKEIVDTMAEFLESRADIRRNISLEDYRRELVSSVLEGDIETSKTYEELSDYELVLLDELVEVLVENAGTWNNPNCLYDYMSFSNINTYLYNKLYDAVTNFWTQHTKYNAATVRANTTRFMSGVRDKQSEFRRRSYWYDGEFRYSGFNAMSDGPGFSQCTTTNTRLSAGFDDGIGFDITDIEAVCGEKPSGLSWRDYGRIFAAAYAAGGHDANTLSGCERYIAHDGNVEFVEAVLSGLTGDEDIHQVACRIADHIDFLL